MTNITFVISTKDKIILILTTLSGFGEVLELILCPLEISQLSNSWNLIQYFSCSLLKGDLLDSQIAVEIKALKSHVALNAICQKSSTWLMRLKSQMVQLILYGWMNLLCYENRLISAWPHKMFVLFLLEQGFLCGRFWVQSPGVEMLFSTFFLSA